MTDESIFDRLVVDASLTGRDRQIAGILLALVAALSIPYGLDDLSTVVESWLKRRVNPTPPTPRLHEGDDR